jgi:hypothetical protein
MLCTLNQTRLSPGNPPIATTRVSFQLNERPPRMCRYPGRNIHSLSGPPHLVSPSVQPHSFSRSPLLPAPSCLFPGRPVASAGCCLRVFPTGMERVMACLPRRSQSREGDSKSLLPDLRRLHSMEIFISCWDRRVGRPP